MNEIQESQEDYLKAIYLISKKNRGGWVSNSEIAEILKVKPSSVTNMLYKLKKLGFINWDPRKSIRLTKDGKERAKSILKRYNALKDFFINILDLHDEDTINELCCKIEHHLNKEAYNALYQLNTDLS
ncbi:MAG: metal-dependent transcriptional regulator [Promethearchaeota archaeon]|nr:MAG: metal-dependent transcriptional regulator [Candidatus Lokiarchaeota archaeon]